ncbi:MAG: Rid family hydrolase [Salinivenus sp.]
MTRQTVSTGTDWDPEAGQLLGVRVGSHVSGTTATDADGEIGSIGDPYRQTRQALSSLELALREAGAALDDVHVSG